MHTSSPSNEDGSCLAHYEWRDTAPQIALLTWVARDGEWVMGVRVRGAAPPDPRLGFGVGAHRHEVLECLPGIRGADQPVATLPLVDAALHVLFSDDMVVEIRLQAAMRGASTIE